MCNILKFSTLSLVRIKYTLSNILAVYLVTTLAKVLSLNKKNGFSEHFILLFYEISEYPNPKGTFSEMIHTKFYWCRDVSDAIMHCLWKCQSFWRYLNQHFYFVGKILTIVILKISKKTITSS